MAQEGTIKWFDREKGYGFITPDDGGEDLLVHYTGVRGTGFRGLVEGQRVTYDLTDGREGRRRATNVTKPCTPNSGFSRIPPLPPPGLRARRRRA
jgi:CspA family cold shock protein